MIDIVVLVPKAIDDISDAFAWYEGRSEGLGERFLGRVDECISRIQRAPMSLKMCTKAIAARLCIVFRLLFFTNLVTILLPSIPFFTVHKILKSGESVCLDRADGHGLW